MANVLGVPNFRIFTVLVILKGRKLDSKREAIASIAVYPSMLTLLWYLLIFKPPPHFITANSFRGVKIVYLGD